MIRVESLTKKFGDRTAVDDISFEVGKGEIIGFLGPNGAGKSTTLRMLTGFLKPSAGRIQIGGIDAVADPVGSRRLIGYMPESVPLYGELRVDEYLRYRARLKGVPRKQVSGMVGRALELARVTDVRWRIIRQLSKGYRSRVGLADALVADPPLLVLDEPTAGLDPNQIRQVRDLIRAMGKEKTVLLSTHILPEVESTCSRVLIIDKGQMVGEGSPGELRVGGQGGQVITLEGRGTAERFGQALDDVEGVRRVLDTVVLEQAGNDSVLRLRLEAEAGDVAERVFAAVAAAGLGLRELSREQTSLEDVFASLTVHDRAGETAETGDPPAAERPAAQATDDGPSDVASEADETATEQGDKP